jgi:UDP-3-O-[3-hydroxymyristoyl] glucosamine N-acyltransferase
MAITLAQIAQLTGGRLSGDGDRMIERARPLEEAGATDVSFVANEKALARLTGCDAGALIVQDGLELSGRDIVFHENPHAAMSLVLEELYPDVAPAPGAHERAVVDPSAQLGEGVSVAPFAVVEADVVLSAGVRIGTGAHIGRGVVIGEGTIVHPRAVLYPRVKVGKGCVVHSGAVLGADGFGFVTTDGRHVKVPQVGGVEVGDDVEIGANSCIDAGTLGPTRIGDNTKVDDLVMIGHNNQIGRSVLLCGQVGLAGSNTIEDHVVLTGQTGVSGHLHVGKGAMAAAKCAITRDVEPGEKVAGVPHMPLGLWRRVWKASQRLPEMRREMKALLRRVDDLERLVDSEAHDVR